MNNTDKKHFSEWMELKENVHIVGRIPAIKEGEIWWSAIGENVGIEINGKSNAFSRPVLIFKKLSRLGFLGIPLTSQHHDGDWYVKFIFQNKQSVAVLSQVRVMSTSRLYRRMGTIPNSDLDLIRSGFSRLYLNK